jgi:hypothetical protein
MISMRKQELQRGADTLLSQGIRPFSPPDEAKDRLIDVLIANLI